LVDIKVLSPLIPLSNQIISKPHFLLFERGRLLERGLPCRFTLKGWRPSRALSF
jgi:hypothetical protein